MIAYPATIRVDLDVIAANMAAIREVVGVPAMAVVKADAYGHGAVPVAKAALRGGAHILGSAQANEALSLRNAGITAPLMTWLYQPGDSIETLLEADVDVSVANVEHLAQVERAAKTVGRRARVHVKLDTGMGRNGSSACAWPQLVEAIADAQKRGSVHVVGAWSHFANSDVKSHPSNDAQRDAFAAGVDALLSVGVEPELVHLSNSAGALTRPDARFSMVRIGLAMYGVNPMSDGTKLDGLQLTPAMRMSARLAMVKDAPAGYNVSYGHTYSTQNQTRLGLVPVGYGDGIPRSASNRAPVSIMGESHRIAGTVCMDQFTVDLGASSPAQAGDEVVLFGDPALGEPSITEWADACGTISWEIMTRIAPRLPRQYVSSVEQEKA